MAYCKNCGRELKNGVAFCTYCGTKTDSQIPAPKKNTRIAFKPLLLGAVILILAALVIGVGVKRFRGGANESNSAKATKKEAVAGNKAVKEEKKEDNKETKQNYEKVTDFEYKIKDNTVSITKYKGHDLDVVIPDTIEGLPVTEIGDKVFASMNIYTVKLPKNLETIQNSAFSHSSIKEIVFPEGLKNICESAFSQTDKLKEVTFPSSVEFIGYNCFGHSALEKITFIKGKQMAVIGEYAFNECENLNCDIVIPGNYMVIEEYAFCKTGSTTFTWEPAEYDGEIVFGNGVFRESGVKEVNIQMGISEVPLSAFCLCKELKKYEIPSTVTYIKDDAFAGCQSLESINLHEGLTMLGVRAFEKCSSITQIILPSTIEEIHGGCFTDCTSVTSIEFKEGEKPASINGGVFTNCGDVEEIYIPKNYTRLEAGFVFHSLKLFRWETGGEKFPEQIITENCIIGGASDVEIFFPRGMIFESEIKQIDKNPVIQTYTSMLISGTNYRKVKIHVDRDNPIAQFDEYSEFFEYYD